MLKISKWLRSASYIATTVVVATIGGCGEENSTPCRPGSEQGWCWQNPRPQGNPLMAVAATADGTRAFAVGVQGTVIRTGNSGANWIWLPSPTKKTLWDVALRGNTSLWAVGDAGTFIRSTDAGLTWTPISATTNTLLNVQMVNATTGYASGYGSTFLKTTDGGATWSSLSFPLPAYAGGLAYASRMAEPGWVGPEILIDMQFVDATKGWVVGVDGKDKQSLGTVWKTTNGGSTWSAVVIAPETVVRIRFKDASLGAALTMSGRTYLTTDGGLSWSPTGLARERFGTMLNENPVMRIHGTRLITGPEYSDDGGVTWSTDSALDQNSIIAVVGAASASSLYGVGIKGELLYSNDNALTWTLQSIGDTGSQMITSIDMLATNNNRGWAAGLLGYVLKTENGKDWFVQDAGVSSDYDLYAVKAFNANVAIIAGGGYPGIVLKRTLNGGASWTDSPITGTLPPNPSGKRQHLRSLSFSGTHGLAVGTNATILKSANNGAVWTVKPTVLSGIPLSSSSAYVELMSAKMVSATEGYVTGICRQVWTDTTPVGDPDDCDYEGISAGTVTFVLKTVDGGDTWTYKKIAISSSQDTNPSIVDADFVDVNTGWIVETFDMVNYYEPKTRLWKTTDGGVTWVDSMLPFDIRSIKIRFADANTGWIAGATGSSGLMAGYGGFTITAALYATTDGGTTWTRQGAGSAMALGALHVYDTTHARVGGMMSHILATSNGGVVTP